MQHFGQDAVLRRREERRMHAHHEQRGHERRQVLARKPEGGERHDHDLDRLDDLEHERLVETIRQLACHAREEHEGQNEDATGEIGQKPRIECRVSARVISGENDQDVLVDVVIERSQRLCAEERQKTPLPEQAKLAVLAHDRLVVSFSRSGPDHIGVETCTAKRTSRSGLSSSAGRCDAFSADPSPAATLRISSAAGTCSSSCRT